MKIRRICCSYMFSFFYISPHSHSDLSYDPRLGTIVLGYPLCGKKQWLSFCIQELDHTEPSTPSNISAMNQNANSEPGLITQHQSPTPLTLPG